MLFLLPAMGFPFWMLPMTHGFVRGGYYTALHRLEVLSGFGMDLSDWPDSGNPVSADLLYYIFGFQSVAGYFL